MVSTTSVSGPRVHSLLVSAKRQWPGRGVARVWYNRGVRTLEDVAACKGGIKLTAAQMIGLKYYDGASSIHRLFLYRIDSQPYIRGHQDINTRIPREEVQEIYDLIQAEGEQSVLRRWSPLTRVMLALRLDPKLFIRVMGSFRRSVASSGSRWRMPMCSRFQQREG